MYHGYDYARVEITLPYPWDFLGKNTGVGSYSLLQGIFPTQGSNLSLLHWQEDSSYLVSHLIFKARLTWGLLNQF